MGEAFVWDKRRIIKLFIASTLKIKGDLGAEIIRQMNNRCTLNSHVLIRVLQNKISPLLLLSALQHTDLEIGASGGHKLVATMVKGTVFNCQAPLIFKMSIFA